MQALSRRREARGNGSGDRCHDDATGDAAIPFAASATLSIATMDALRQQQEDAQPWNEKYRPSSLDGVVGQRGSVATLRGLMLGPHATFPHTILCGPAGAGKTTCMLAIARQLYGRYAVTVTGNQAPLSDMVLVINASDENGIEAVRNRISSFVSANGSIMRSMGIKVRSGRGDGGAVAPSDDGDNGNDDDARTTAIATGSTAAVCAAAADAHSAGDAATPATVGALCDDGRFLPKLILMDEADHLTPNAQNALRSLMEKYAAQVRFCFIVNYEHRMHDAICSRCLRLRFAPLDIDDVLLLLERVSRAEQIALGDGALRAIADVTGGDMRQALNTLQACAMHVRGGDARPLASTTTTTTTTGATSEDHGAGILNVTASTAATAGTLGALTVYRITGKPPPQATRSLLRNCLAHHDDIAGNVARINAYIDHFGVSLKATVDAMCAVVLRKPEAYRALGFAHTAMLAHFLVGLETAQRRIVLVTDAGRMRLHVAALAALVYRLHAAESCTAAAAGAD